MLTLPQSVGVVGGRPSASLLFVGHQDSSLLYLDPHEAQPVAELPQDLHTYFCNTLRLMPISSMDPSVAIGLHCKDPGEGQGGGCKGVWGGGGNRQPPADIWLSAKCAWCVGKSSGVAGDVANWAAISRNKGKIRLV